MKHKLLHKFIGSISSQLTVIYLSLSLLIILIMAVIASLFIPRIYSENYLAAVNNATTITANKLSDIINNVDTSVSSLFSSNTTFLNTLSTDYTSVKEGLLLHDSALSMFTTSIRQNTPDREYFMNFFLFVDSNLPLSRFCADFSKDLFYPVNVPANPEYIVLSNSTSLNSQSWFQKTKTLNDSFYWFTDKETGCLYGAKAYTHANQTSNTSITLTNIGVLVISLKPEYFLAQIQNTMSGTQNAVVALKLSDSEIWLNSLSEKHTYYTNEIELPIGITVVVHTPKHDINRLANVYIYFLLLLTVIILLCTIFVIQYISKIVTRPIVQLSQHMDSSQALKPIAVEGIPNNEITNIYTTYNNMLTRIEKLITEKEAETAKRKEQEFATYQLQINPHFLYNTLNTMACHMMLKGDNTMVSALNILADHLRYNYKEPNAEVSISEELTKLRNYVQLQNIQYQNRIILTTEIPDEHLTFSVCKMILQPLAENAISYELGRFDDESMQIRIFSYTESNTLKLCVGNDMICEDVDLINDHIAGNINISKHSGGLGTRNINDRLKLKYGPEYGLKFYTTDTETVACLTLPLR